VTIYPRCNATVKRKAAMHRSVCCLVRGKGVAVKRSFLGFGAACGPLRQGSRTPKGKQACPPQRQRAPPSWRSDSPNATRLEITTYVHLSESHRHTATLPTPFWEVPFPAVREPLPKFRHDGSQKVRPPCPKHQLDTTTTDPQTELPPCTRRENPSRRMATVRRFGYSDEDATSLLRSLSDVRSLFGCP
jgi:hypothetical protein